MTNTRIAHKAERQLILIDIENLTGTPSPTSKRSRGQDSPASGRARVRQRPAHRRLQPPRCPHRGLRVSGARHLWRSGPDGADRALLDVLENERVDERFERVTICSGDGIFAAVRRLARRG